MHPQPLHRRPPRRRVSARQPVRLLLVLATVGAVALAGQLVTSAATSVGTGTLTGVVWKDLDRDGTQDAGEDPLPDQRLYVITSSGTLAGTVLTDANGHWQLDSLAAGTYRATFDNASWTRLRHDWVPSTSAGTAFETSATLADGGTARAVLGLRPIVRSTDLSAPLSTATAASGLQVRSYDDAVDASTVLTALQAGGSLGVAAATTTVNFDYGTQVTNCVTSVSGSPGSYSSFSSTVWVDYLSWLDLGDEVLWHEYGHAWTYYADKIVQQDGTFSTYLAARGVTNDPRLSTSKAWDPSEMAAEDYRQLFGSPSAAAYPQANTDLPRAVDVPGLSDFFHNVYAGSSPGPSPTSSPSPSPTSTTSPSPTPTTTTSSPTAAPTSSPTAAPTSSPSPTAVVLTVDAPTVNPVPVSKSATVTTGVSQQATVTVEVRDGSGRVVRTLLGAVAEPLGQISLTWDRRDDRGRRVRAGRYLVHVEASTSDGTSATASTPVSVV